MTVIVIYIVVVVVVVVVVGWYPQATATEQHETGRSLKKDLPTIKLRTAHSTSYRTFHKLP